MSTSGFTFDGLDLVGTRTLVTGAALTLVCYTNTADSLGDGTLLADLTQPTGGGYAPIVLTPANWTINDGIATYSPNPTWSASGVWSATVVGTALVNASIVFGFRDLTVPFVAAAGKKLTIDLTTVL